MSFACRSHLPHDVPDELLGAGPAGRRAAGDLPERTAALLAVHLPRPTPGRIPQVSCCCENFFFFKAFFFLAVTDLSRFIFIRVPCLFFGAMHTDCHSIRHSLGTLHMHGARHARHAIATRLPRPTVVWPLALPGAARYWTLALALLGFLFWTEGKGDETLLRITVQIFSKN